MLILAGVAISIAVSPDGLFGQAQNATKQWNDKVAEEQDAIGGMLEDYVGGQANAPDVKEGMIPVYYDNGWKKADKTKLQQVFELCRCLEMHITQSNGFENAQVCTGGVDLREVSDELESLYAPNIYFAGEILDVDGRCGGYNLQWAWTSGYIAGMTAATKK